MTLPKNVQKTSINETELN